ncbi:MAG: type I restriction-modification system subunit M [Bacteroidetes bacterium]|nr:type I restriction-modification system subunit M [Bacteroidota bacterium]
MDAQHSKIVSFIWGIADDVLRDVYVRGKYRDVILPMVVLRRLDAVLEGSKAAVLDTKKQLDTMGVVQQAETLAMAAGQAFYNDSPFTLRDLRSVASAQRLKDDFLAYLDGFSPNVQEVLEKFSFREQVTRLSSANVLGPLLGKFLAPDINLSPFPVRSADGVQTLPGLDNHAMGTIFEELIRQFNEENNEEAGEHFTPRDVVSLMADLIFAPIAEQITPGTYLVYDGACGTGGMLTVAEERLVELARGGGKDVSVHVYGQEVNPETYAITKADLLLKGEGEEAANIRLGSTLASDHFPTSHFDFMLSNPPYGKAWKTDLERMGGKDDLRDPRFVVRFAGEEEPTTLITRSSDGQLMFLMNMVAKMKDTPRGSRLAVVHNGSALFTGDAGSGESSIRRYLLENDLLEAIVALPQGMFYNTGIATYVWLLTNRKAEHRHGQVQLIDATTWSVPRRKNLGKKNVDLSEADRTRIVQTVLDFDASLEDEHSKVFANAHFGYWKVTIERPLRLRAQITPGAVERLRFASGDEDERRRVYDTFGDDLYRRFAALRPDVEALLRGSEDEEDGDGVARLPEKRIKKLLDPATWLRDYLFLCTADRLRQVLGEERFDDFNVFRSAVDAAMKREGLKLGTADKKAFVRLLAWRDEEAPPVVKSIVKRGEAEPLYGRFEALLDGTRRVVEYESDPELRDTESVPLLEAGGIEAFVRREVLPFVPDAWIDASKTTVGYEISFTREFYRPAPLRTLAEIRADIESIESETDGLLDAVLLHTEDA